MKAYSVLFVITVFGCVFLASCTEEKSDEKSTPAPVKWGVRFSDKEPCMCADPTGTPHHARPSHHPHQPKTHHKHNKDHHHGRRHHKRRMHTPMYCKCLPKMTEKKFAVKMTFNMTFVDEMKDVKSIQAQKLIGQVETMIRKILKPKKIGNWKLFKGSVIVSYELTYDMASTENPEPAIRAAIKKGELKELKVVEEHVYVQDAYPGVKIGQWQTNEDDHEEMCENYHHKHGKAGEEKMMKEECIVLQERSCYEVNNSCEGILLKREVSCFHGCSKSWWDYGCWRYTHGHRVIYLVCGVIAAIMMLTLIISLVVRKRSLRYVEKRTSSDSDLKHLTDADYCAGPLPTKTPLA
ncbi:predicted protein [Nematostella vectensis]|uniref:SEA domain-containing protein n=1 Tax=Nematostella vectensis TaxID=45351 RepID=A7SRT5_NEMVE|nr:predicted protein [Nematostella vectensis]|eukprot:XP_001625689.1 predicted protein [Nematostella vectensis]